LHNPYKADPISATKGLPSLATMQRAAPATTFKTVWAAVKDRAGITGRWHDNRHTFITDLAESGEAGDETIRDLAGHVSQRMLKHYSHIRMQAKRRAVDTLVTARPATTDGAGERVSFGAAKESAKVGRTD